MPDQVHLAIDCGAESGRIIAGLWDGSHMRLEELLRFPTGGSLHDGGLRWEVERFWTQIENGLAAAAARFGSSIVSVGADTWGLDYVLLNSAGRLLEMPWHYRDRRNFGLMARMLSKVPRAEIFAATGTQFMEINTLCQLTASELTQPGMLARADRLLMIPDYFHYRLCGARVGEFTNATTTQCFHPTQRTWSTDLLTRLGIPTKMLPPVVAPGSRLGSILKPIAARTGLSSAVEVIAPATHDTASAVAGLPALDAAAGGRVAFLSSGTWSLLGVELPEPNLSERALAENFTNEGGLDGRYRFLKNVMGLWLVQQCRRSFEERGGLNDYGALIAGAQNAPAFRSLVDPDDSRFLNPPDMIPAIIGFCRETGQPEPESKDAFIRCALESLALKYARVLRAIVDITGSPVAAINIVGGGSRNQLLNQFTADACQLPVFAGPVEATALGNLLVQARGAGALSSLDQMKAAASASSEIERFDPRPDAAWAEAAARFDSLCTRA